MNNAQFNFKKPENEPSMTYAPGCPERELLKDAIAKITVAIKTYCIAGGT